MTNKTRNLVDDNGSVLKQALVDNGDGTFSPQFSAVGGSTNALPTFVTPATRTCKGHQTITGLSAVTPATLTVPSGSVAATVQAENGQVRMTMDGSTNPTAAIGTRIDDGVIYFVDSNPAQVKLLAVAGTTTNVNIAYFDKA